MGSLVSAETVGTYPKNTDNMSVELRRVEIVSLLLKVYRNRNMNISVTKVICFYPPSICFGRNAVEIMIILCDCSAIVLKYSPPVSFKIYSFIKSFRNPRHADKMTSFLLFLLLFFSSSSSFKILATNPQTWWVILKVILLLVSSDWACPRSCE